MRRHLGEVLVAGGLLAACGGGARAQSPPASPAPCTVAPQPAPCSAAPAQTGKPAAERFPFPGEASPATPQAPGATPQTPDAAGTDAAKKQAAKSFPFPGENAKPAADSSSSSSSSSSSGDDAGTDPATPDAAGLKDKGSEGQAPQGRRLLHRVNPVGTKLQTPEEREAEDLDVAHFYSQSGDLQGAYTRSQDAVKTMPDDPDAHFALAEIARKLNKADEAIAEYNACLKLDPDPKQAKAARKELERLKP